MYKNISYDSSNSQLTAEIPTPKIDLYLVYCGYHKCKPAYIFNHPELTEYHLHFVINGKGTLIVNNITYSVSENDIFILPKGQIVKYYADSKNPWEYVWITFDGTLAETYLAYANITLTNPIIHSNISNKIYLNYVDKIIETNEPTFSDELKRASYLFEIISTLIDAQSSKHSSKLNINTADSLKNSSTSAYVESALQYINTNYSSISVNDIANHVGLNRSYLSTIFKKHLNISPQQYLLNYKLNKAEELLRTTKNSICTIASTIGYDDCIVFSKIFKKTFGLTPTNYRNQFSSNEKIGQRF